MSPAKVISLCVAFLLVGVALGLGIANGRSKKFDQLTSSRPMTPKERGSAPATRLSAESDAMSARNASQGSEELTPGLFASAKQKGLTLIAARKKREFALDYKTFTNGLPDDQVTKLQALIEKKHLGALEGLLDLRARGESPLSQAEFAKRFHSQIDSEIEALLGREQYSAFKQYEDALPYVKATEKLEYEFSANGSPLSKEQSDGLLHSMLAHPANSADVDAVMSGRLTLDQYRQRLAGTSDAMIQSVAQTLSPAQLKLLKSHEETSINDRIAGLKKLLGGP